MTVAALGRGTQAALEGGTKAERAGQGAGAALADQWGRRITYLRLSVTDRCDFRCQYCMPEKMRFLPKREIMSLEECLAVARVFSEMGVGKIRITGGEPLVRKNVVWLLAQIARLPGVCEVAVTSNGSQLPRLAGEMAAAGVNRVNISLDTLDAEKFARLTRTGSLAKVLAGIDAALAAGFPGGVKINTVMVRGINDGELSHLARFAFERGMDISFIEEMPMGEAGLDRGLTYYGADEALPELRDVFALRPSEYSSGGPARYWQAESGRKIGFITPHSHNFCESCNRVRVAVSGELYPCLGQNGKVDLLPALRESEDADSELRARILEAMRIKPKGHEFDLHGGGVQVVRFMSATGG